MKENYQVYYTHFDHLTPHELYAMLQLRAEIFVLEQHCIYLDEDGKDLVSNHLMIWDHAKLIACSRLIPPSVAYPEMSIGRVVNSKAYRGKGVGKLLMQASVEAMEKLYGTGPIKIGAQLYLKKFYESFGFVKASDMYLEDNIEHILMIRG